MTDLILQWLASESTARWLGSLIVVPLVGSAWLFRRAAQRYTAICSLWSISAWCASALCLVPLFEVLAPMTWQNGARLAFLVTVLFGWYRIYRTVPSLLRFPRRFKPGEICDSLLCDVDEIIDGRRKRGVQESTESEAAINRTKSVLLTLSTNMKATG